MQGHLGSVCECGKEAGRTNHRDNAARGISSAKKDGSGREEDDSKPSPVTSGACRTNQKRQS
jgi:hypothetical protein